MPDSYIPWSQREGLTEVRTQIQDSGMDRPLRVDLWNALYENVTSSSDWHDLVWRIWRELLREPLDEYGDTSDFSAFDMAKDWILRADWRLTCDVIAFAAEQLTGRCRDQFIVSANAGFDRGKFAWRFSGRKLVRRIGDAEIRAVETALQDSQPFPEVLKQLETALAEFSSRENANYGHAAKEAISAAESLMKHVTGDPNVTLGEGLKQIRKSGTPQIHPALLSSFDSLWGYACEKGYLRHGAKPGNLADVTLEEAQLVLVTSSAVVSFLIARAGCEGMLG